MKLGRKLIYKSSFQFFIFSASVSYLMTQPGLSQENDSSEKVPLNKVLNSKIASATAETLYIYGTKDHEASPGAVNRISKQELEKHKYTDIEKILDAVPGVSLQSEDGYGLRPNIGIRGVNPHRSKKVCLMEDEVLLAPAPYSAPAAYYFPTTEFVDSVEVVKGPSAIIYGPNTIGGSVQLRSMPIPDQALSTVSLGAGSFGEAKVTASTGNTIGPWGYLIALSRQQADGFMELDSGDPVGFFRNDLMLKLRREFESGQALHRVRFKYKAGYENSYATYLGVTKTDFDNDPYKRYAASQKDEMEWDRQSYLLGYDYESDLGSKVSVNFYNANFHRDWEKVGGFGNDTVDIRDLLVYPDSDNSAYFDVLTGKEDSTSNVDNFSLTMGRADRYFNSRGVSLRASIPVFTQHEDPDQLNIGLRYHLDSIRRDHSSTRYSMVGGKMEKLEDTYEQGSQEKDSADAISAFTQYEWRMGRHKIVPGVRYEHIKTTSENLRDDDADKIEYTEVLWSPGLGISHNLSEAYTLFYGAYKGYSPTSPGQTQDIDPEESANYELGLGYSDKHFNLTTIGFYNSYTNIKGICSLSTGCDAADVDKEFNGGKAKVYGSEFDISYSRTWQGLTLVSGFTYTYTFAAFTEERDSDNEDWGVGTIKSGDPLPYIPKEKWNLRLGLREVNWGFHIKYSHTGHRYDQSVVDGRKTIDPYGLLDVAGNYQVYDNIDVYAKVDNALDKTYVSSLRPNGYRPGKPRSFQVGTRVDF